MAKAFVIDSAASNRILEAIDQLLCLGEIRLTWDDIRPILVANSDALISYGHGSGKTKVNQACEEVIAGLAIYETRRLMKKIAVHIEGSKDLTLQDVNIVISTIKAATPMTCETIFGVKTNPDLHDGLKLTMLAAYESYTKLPEYLICLS